MASLIILFNWAMFRVVDFFGIVCHFALFPLVFFLQPSLHTILKHFPKLRTRLQRSKGLGLSACFRVVNVSGLVKGVIVQLQVL